MRNKGYIALALFGLLLFPVQTPAKINNGMSSREFIEANAPIKPSNGLIRYNTGNSAASDIYNQDYDDSWRSMRTYQLMQVMHEPIRIHIETHATDTKLYKGRYVNYVKESMDAWADALEGRLKYTVVDDPREAHIRFRWVAGFADPEMAGETVYTIEKADIEMKTPGIEDRFLKANIMHEIGHALGISEHSHNDSDIMKSGRGWASVAEYKNYVPKLSERDKQAIRHLYSVGWKQGEDLYRAVASKPAAPARVASAQPAVRQVQQQPGKLQIAIRPSYNPIVRMQNQ